MDTQTQIDRLIELAIIQRSELKQLVEQLPQLREHLNAEVEKVFDETEPQLRAELEEWTTKQTADKTAALGVALEAKIADLAKSLEVSTQARYNAIIAERAENARLAAQAEAKIAEHAASLPSAVKDIVTAELARFPRAGEIDQLRKEFAEPRGLNPRGKWQAGESYNKLDLVTINGDSYTSNTDGNRTRPSRSSADWTLVAARGTGGGGGPTSLSELTTVPSDGDVLIGSGTSWVTSNLTAGAGISITVGPGAITISATDGDITLDDGTAASPSLHFTNDPDTGIYRPAANTLGISVSGTQVAYFDENGLTVPSAGVVAGGSFHGANGNANNPSFSFTSDQDTGFYRHGTNELGISIGGTQKAVMTSTTFTVTPNLVSSGTTTMTGAASGSTLSLSSNLTVNGAIIAAGQSVIVNPSSGTAKGRINSDPFRADVFQLGSNWTGGAQDDATKPSWYWFFDSRVAGDAATLYRVPPGGSSTSALAISSTAATLSGNLTVSGGTITGGASGMSLASGGTNQNITLTPSGTGRTIINANGLALNVTGTNDTSLVYGRFGTSSSTGQLFVGVEGSVAGILNTGTLAYAGYIGTASSGTALQLATGGGVRATITSGGNFLIGTTVDSSALLQVGTNTTTAANGMKFGTDVSLFRSAAGVLRLASTANYSHEIVNTGGTGAATTSYSNTGGYLFVGIDSSSGGALGGGAYAGVIARDGAYSLILRTNSTTALTLDSSQNATFAGDRVINRKDQNAVTRLQVRNDTSGTSGQAQISATVGDFTTYTALGQLSAGFTSTGLYQANSGYLVGSNALYIFTASGSSLVLGTNNTTALTLDSSQNATFAGNIKTAAPSGGTAATWRLGTVATVSPTSPNRTIEVEIGGTTYYIHAKTTNN